MHTHQLIINLGANTPAAIFHLQQLKDAMAMAIMQKIECTGIQGPQDAHFASWQAIYLEADHTLHNLTSFAAPPIGGE